MRNDESSLEAKLFRGLKLAMLLAVTAARFLARYVSCYIQTQHEYNELARLNHQSLRDIGLSPTDVAVMTGRPIWRRCWQSVRSCPNRSCRASSLCVAECRRTLSAR
jgi:uncharacterized protein YjiS (DUF1127 family)